MLGNTMHIIVLKCSVSRVMKKDKDGHHFAFYYFRVDEFGVKRSFKVLLSDPGFKNLAEIIDVTKYFYYLSVINISDGNLGLVEKYYILFLKIPNFCQKDKKYTSSQANQIFSSSSH